MITVVVEGDTDIPFVDKLCAEVGLDVRLPVIDAAGKGRIDANLAGYARASSGSPHFLLRDLDNDAPCAPSWLLANAPQNAGEYFCLRIAVREIEAWFLADKESAAAMLHVAKSAIPLDPDAEADPTATIVALARRSNKPRIKNGLVPAAGTVRTVGPDYERWLIASAATWSVRRAIHRSDSLRRARKALVRLKEAWDAVLTGRQI